MPRYLLSIVTAITVFASIPSFACDAHISCDKCAKASEFSWNPHQQYTTARLNHFYSLDDRMTAAYTANNFDEAKALANEYLELAAVYRCNWNYGNAIHDANKTLGWVSLKSGDLNAAAEYLVRAGKSTGSPQLDSFGPDLDLANALLKLGKVDAVRTYLTDIKSFWETNGDTLDRWLAEIERGETPELDRFSRLESRPWVQAIIWFASLWPVIVAAVSVFILRTRIRKKLWVFILGALAGYVAMYATNAIFAYAMVTAVSSGNMPDGAIMSVLIYLPIAVLVALPIVTVLAVARFFYLGSNGKAL